MTDTTYNTDWHDEGEYSWRETDDPRVIAVIVPDSDYPTPYGDCIAPSVWFDYGHRSKPSAVADTHEDDDIIDAFIEAVDYFGRGAMDRVERYLRLFHGLHDMREVGIDRGFSVFVLDSPGWREACGIEPDAADVLSGSVEEWKAYAMNEVYGVGYVAMPERVERYDLDGLGFDTDILGGVQYWGVFGEEWARIAAVDEAAYADLPDLLPL